MKLVILHPAVIEAIKELKEWFPTSDADMFAAMPPLKQSDVRAALDELPPIVEQEEE